MCLSTDTFPAAGEFLCEVGTKTYKAPHVAGRQFRNILASGAHRRRNSTNISHIGVFQNTGIIEHEISVYIFSFRKS